MYTIPKGVKQPKWVHDHFDMLNQVTKRLSTKQLACTSKLSEIAAQYKNETDKSPSSSYYIKHNYTEFYGDLLEKWVAQGASLLEIGVRDGGSLQMWRDFLEDGKVYGLDLSLKNYKFPACEGIVLTQGNAYASKVVQNFFPGVLFDIIVDDGSHALSDQTQVLNLYNSRLKPGGVIIIEDIKDLANARTIIENFTGRRNKVSIVDRRHCVPSLDDINVIYFNT